MNYSIGFRRDDGNFQILATLNNHHGLILEGVMENIATNLQAVFQRKIEDEKIEILERQDCPDYVNLEEEK